MPSPGAYVTDVDVQSVRKSGRKYEYVIKTIWSDGGRFEIYRRYAEFFVFQNTLLKLYPKEAGKYEEKDRVIPFLPNVDNAFKLFGRTNSESVMKQRLNLINLYCKTILLKHPSMGRGDHALNFFRPSPADKQLRRLGKPMSLHPQKIPSGAGNLWEEHVLLVDFVPDKDKKTAQLEMKAGESVVVMRKDDSGWYLCSASQGKRTGWIPESFLKKRVDDHDSLELGDIAEEAVDKANGPDSDHEDGDGSLPRFRAIDDYDTSDAGQVSFPAGAILLVVDQDEDGWWFVKYNDKEGWAPCSYLEPEDQSEESAKELTDEIRVVPDVSISKDDTDEEAPSVFYAKREYQSDLEDELSFPTGASITVLNKSISGWWTARYDGKLGVVPATYLSEVPISIEPEASASESTIAVNTLVPKFSRPPPRRRTVRQTVMQKRQQLNL